jgi:predicted signal transduction protein with EAL and GGDEF domain
MTQHLPARPIGHRDPIIARVDTTTLEPEVHDFRAHDMNVTIRLNLLGWQLATFNIDLDMGKFVDDTPTRRALDGACKRLSRRWVNAMTS